MNQLVQSQEQIQPQSVQAQWVEFIMPVVTGIMMLVFITGMIRDVVKGKEVKLPRG